jgi:hypothetical protein
VPHESLEHSQTGVVAKLSQNARDLHMNLCDTRVADSHRPGAFFHAASQHGAARRQINKTIELIISHECESVPDDGTAQAPQRPEAAAVVVTGACGVDGMPWRGVASKLGGLTVDDAVFSIIPAVAEAGRRAPAVWAQMPPLKKSSLNIQSYQ